MFTAYQNTNIYIDLLQKNNYLYYLCLMIYDTVDLVEVIKTR